MKEPEGAARKETTKQQAEIRKPNVEKLQRQTTK
jgi:hypothetical protein